MEESVSHHPLPRRPPPRLSDCVAGGERDESDDTVGDLRRTESDGVLKKVGISAANYPPVGVSVEPPLFHHILGAGGCCAGAAAFVLRH